MSGAVPDDVRHSVITPNGRYRYQLRKVGGGEASNMFTVWHRDLDRTRLSEVMILVEGSGYGPHTVGSPCGDPPADTYEVYMRAAGHIWAARQAGLWTE